MNGIDCKCYYNSASYGSPTWVEIDIIKDLNVTGKWKEGDSSTRANIVETMEPTQFQMEIAGMILASLTNAVFLFIDAAFIARTEIDILVLNGPNTTNGVRGYRSGMKVLDLGEDQKIDGVLFRSFTMKPCISANPTKRVVVSGGVPVYTAIGS